MGVEELGCSGLVDEVKGIVSRNAVVVGRMALVMTVVGVAVVVEVIVVVAVIIFEVIVSDGGNDSNVVRNEDQIGDDLVVNVVD